MPGIRMRSVNAAGIIGATLLAIIALYIPVNWIGDLGPTPDAQEYAITAMNLAHGGVYTISLLGRHSPPRYPFGFPALMAPAYWLPGATLGNGIYAVVGYGVLAAVASYALGRSIAGHVAGAVAAITLLALPEYQLWNHEIMSETASAALATLAALLLHRVVVTQDHNRRPILLATLGVVSGIAMLVHVTNLALPTAVLIALLADASVRQRLVPNLAAFAVGPLTAAAALGIYDHRTFGAVTRTGYEYWVPQWYSSLTVEFSPAYALNAPGIGDPSTPHLSNVSYYLGALTGLSAFHSIPVLSSTFALLAILGIVLMVLAKRPGVLCFALFIVVFTTLTVGTYSLYFFQAARFLAPVVPLLAVAAGVAAGEGSTMLLDGLRRRGLLATVFGLAVTVVTLATLSDAVRLSVQQNFLYQSIVARAQPPGQWNLWTAALYGRTIHGRGIIITDTLLPLLDEAGVTRLTRIIPVSRGEYWDKPPLHGRQLYAQQRRQIDRLIRGGMPVYTDSPTLAAARGNQSLDSVSWTALNSYQRVPVASSGAVVIYRLLTAS